VVRNRFVVKRDDGVVADEKVKLSGARGALLGNPSVSSNTVEATRQLDFLAGAQLSLSVMVTTDRSRTVGEDHRE
jgi:hypothetical protein